MEKNTGKTETLNYVLSSLYCKNLRIALTSVGVDGEKQDSIFANSKPEITIYPQTTFITAEKLYPLKQITASIQGISDKHTALGRLIKAKAMNKGKVLLAGPSDTTWLKKIIDELLQDNDLCLIDGALSRLSFGSPSITEAMILSTGTALSMSINQIVKKTDFVFRMTLLQPVTKNLTCKLVNIKNGIYVIENNENIIPLPIPSLLMLEKYKDIIFSKGKTLFISGILTDSLIKFILTQPDISKIELIIKDFTKIFSSPANTDLFLQNGGKIKVLTPANLIAITINPIAANGFKLNSTKLIDALSNKINIPVYNVKEMN
jgi:hypothetical protein